LFLCNVIKELIKKFVVRHIDAKKIKIWNYFKFSILLSLLYLVGAINRSKISSVKREREREREREKERERERKRENVIEIESKSASQDVQSLQSYDTRSEFAGWIRSCFLLIFLCLSLSLSIDPILIYSLQKYHWSSRSYSSFHFYFSLLISDDDNFAAGFSPLQPWFFIVMSIMLFIR
jgi:hypothetical protein